MRKIYTETLLRKGDIDPKEAEQWLDQFQSKLQEAFDRTQRRRRAAAVARSRARSGPTRRSPAFRSSRRPTPSVPREQLRRVGNALTTVPEDFALASEAQADHHQAHGDGRGTRADRLGVRGAAGVRHADARTASACASPDRTPAAARSRQRHAMLFDYVTGKGYVPLNALSARRRAAKRRSGHRRKRARRQTRTSRAPT